MTNKKKNQIPGKLIPALREAVELAKLIIFKRLSAKLTQQFAAKDPVFGKRMSAAMLNEMFSNANQNAAFKEFTTENNDIIRKEIAEFPDQFSELLIPLSDALRIQFMCDCQDESQDVDFLKKAEDLGVLLIDRDMPMPGSFLNMIGKLAIAEGLVSK